jgi:hypothetical protein
VSPEEFLCVVARLRTFDLIESSASSFRNRRTSSIGT